MIIVAAFMLSFSSCRLLFSFDIYQSLYENLSRKENTPFSGASPAEISLIGSIAASLMKLGAPYVVAWSKYFNPQPVIYAGGLIYGVASVLASFGKSFMAFSAHTRPVDRYRHLPFFYALDGSPTLLVWKT